MQSIQSIDSMYSNNYDNYISNKHNFTIKFISENMLNYYHDYWEILHLIGYIYPDNPTYLQRIDIGRLLNYMANGGIRCNTCTIHFKEFLHKNNLQYICKNNTNLKKFMIDLHNNINKINAKKVFTYSQVNTLYNNIPKRCDKLNKKYKINLYNLMKDNEIYTFINKLN